MNYRHIFHAGNCCDVVKHSLLTLVLKALCQKEKPFVVLDTHAGVGLYDLQDPRALKTNEAAEGILKLVHASLPASLAPYIAVLKIMNPGWAGEGTAKLRVYPGSPMLAFHQLRDKDRLIACELHPDDAAALRTCAPADNRFQVHHRDGYEAMGAFLPPPEKRGLALIDPPFEAPAEFDHIVTHVSAAYKRWSNGTFMIWYPIKDKPAIWRFHESLQNSALAKILCAEFVFEDDTANGHLAGSGLILVNPPWKLDADIPQLFADLHSLWKTSTKKDRVFWIKP